MPGSLSSGSKKARCLASSDRPIIEKSRTKENLHSAGALETGSKGVAHFFL